MSDEKKLDPTTSDAGNDDPFAPFIGMTLEEIAEIDDSIALTDHGRRRLRAAIGNAVRFGRPDRAESLRRLLALLVSGELDGREPIDPDAVPGCERDDAADQLDAGDGATHSRLQPGAVPSPGLVGPPCEPRTMTDCGEVTVCW